jgi:hypothetical protein
MFNESIMSNIIITEKRKVYTNKESDITLIEITNNDEKDLSIDYLELDNNVNKGEDFYDILYKEKPVYVLHYPEGKEVIVSYGILNRIDKEEINHFCSTEKGSSGAPIISLDNLKVIGLHCGGYSIFNFNKGILLKNYISNFLTSFTVKTSTKKHYLNRRIYISQVNSEHSKKAYDQMTNPFNQKTKSFFTNSNNNENKKINKFEKKDSKKVISKLKRHNTNLNKNNNSPNFNTPTNRNSLNKGKTIDNFKKLNNKRNLNKKSGSRKKDVSLKSHKIESNLNNNNYNQLIIPKKRNASHNKVRTSYKDDYSFIKIPSNFMGIKNCNSRDNRDNLLFNANETSDFNNNKIDITYITNKSIMNDNRSPNLFDNKKCFIKKTIFMVLH